MGIYVRADSPFYWMLLERPHLPALKASTKVPRDAPDAMSRKLLRQQAEEVYQARMVELARAQYDLPSLTQIHTITFTAFARWYLDHHLAKQRGAERAAYALKPLEAFFGNDDLTAIARARVSEYETHRAETVTNSTINREVDVLKAMLLAAVPTYLTASPLAGRRKLRIVKLKKRVLSQEEEARLLAELRPADQALYIVAVDTLIRLSNVLNLTRAEDKGTHLELVDSKTGPYEVPLSKRARKALDGLPNTGPYYFQHRRGAKKARDTRGAIRRMLQRACARCKIPYGARWLASPSTRRPARPVRRACSGPAWTPRPCKRSGTGDRSNRWAPTL